jgi:hypothetical protein
MIVLEAGQTLRGVAPQANFITYTIEGMELNAGVESYKTLAQGQLAITVTTLYTVPSSTQAFIKSIHLVNMAGGRKEGIILYIGGAVAANQITGSMALDALGGALFEEDGWTYYSSKGSRKMKLGYD